MLFIDIKSSWGNNQNIEIKSKIYVQKLYQTGLFEIRRSWKISGLWNGIAYSSSETQYIIKNAGYNYEIQPNQEVNFGYCVTGEVLKFQKLLKSVSQRTDKAENEYILFR